MGGACDCPANVRYGVVYEDNGEQRVLAHGAYTEECDVLIGGLNHCDGSVSVSACFGPALELPCLTLQSNEAAEYIDEAGASWLGTWTSNVELVGDTLHIAGTFLATLADGQMSSSKDLRGTLDFCVFPDPRENTCR